MHRQRLRGSCWGYDVAGLELLSSYAMSFNVPVSNYNSLSALLISNASKSYRKLPMSAAKTGRMASDAPSYSIFEPPPTKWARSQQTWRASAEVGWSYIVIFRNGLNMKPICVQFRLSFVTVHNTIYIHNLLVYHVVQSNFREKIPSKRSLPFRRSF